MTNREEASKALEDVREAYRLVWAYQRRVLDIVRIIGDGFNTHQFYYWIPLRAAMPPRSSTNPATADRWAWDLLPMAEASFLYTPGKIDGKRPAPGAWMLDVHVVSDSGFVTKERLEPDPVDFVPAHVTLSQIEIIAWICRDEFDGDWYSAWNEMEWPGGDGIVSEQPPLAGYKHSYDLADLLERPDVDAAVARFKMALGEFNVII